MKQEKVTSVKISKGQIFVKKTEKMGTKVNHFKGDLKSETGRELKQRKVKSPKQAKMMASIKSFK